MINRRKSLLGMTALALSPVAIAAGTDVYPNRPIRLICPSGAGTGSDLIARALSSRLSEVLGQNIFIDNKPGSNGILGLGEAARGGQDGYTLLVCGFAAMVINPWLYKSLPYKPLEDFAPIAKLSSGGVLLLVNPSHPATDVKSYVEWAKKQKNKPIYATWGVGSSAHASMELLGRTTGVSLEHVTYKTIGELTKDLVSGIVEVGWTDPATPIALIKEGRLRPIAVASRERAPLLPDTPTLMEQGIPIGLDGWYGFFARSGTPNSIITRLNNAANDVLRDPNFKELMLRMNGIVSSPAPPQDFTQIVQSDTEQWGQLLRGTGMKPQ